jgi:hypothetical protein
MIQALPTVAKSFVGCRREHATARGGVTGAIAMWFVRYLISWLVAVPLCVLVGAAPDQLLYSHYDGRLGDLPFCATIVAFALGFLITRKRLDSVGQFVFLPGMLLFADGVYESTRSWSFPATTPARIQFLVVNAFGVKPGCEGDCFNALGAIALLPSLAYSIGTLLAIRASRGRKTAELV